MKKIKYLIEFIFIIFLLIIIKILGLKISLFVSSFIFRIIGPLFRTKKISYNNLSIVLPNITKTKKNKIIDMMWENYGKIFSEYMFIKNFRTDPVFLGGSMINHGGQNPLEAVRFGCNIFHGPNVTNFKEIYWFLKNKNLSQRVTNYKNLANLLSITLKNKSQPKKIKYN